MIHSGASAENPGNRSIFYSKTMSTLTFTNTVMYAANKNIEKAET